MPERSLLILSFDGASWEGAEPFLEGGQMPTLKKLVEGGASGPLQSVLPTFTYPAWASFWTGENPGRHLVFAFRELKERGLGRSLVEWSSLKRPTWLELVSDHGLRTVSVYALLTYPPRPVNGYVVGDLSMRDATDFTYPPVLAEELQARFGKLLVPKSEQFFPPGGFPDLSVVQEFVQRQIQSVQQTKDIALYLLRKSPWDVALVHFFATDPLQHALWHYLDPHNKNFNTEGHGIVGKFFAALDTAMSELIENTKPTAILIFSTHGFTTCHKILNLSRYLRDVDVLQDPAPLQRLLRRIQRTRGIWRLNSLLARVSRNVHQIVHGTPWNPGHVFLDHKAIYVKRLGCDSNLITYRLARALEALEDPENGSRVIKKAWRAEELYSKVELPGWDILVLEPADGYTLRTGDFYRPIFWPCRPNQDYLIGTHTQTGVWSFSGTGIASTCGLRASILDLPPTLLACLGTPIPEWMEGKVLPILDSHRAV